MKYITNVHNCHKPARKQDPNVIYGSGCSSTWQFQRHVSHKLLIGHLEYLHGYSSTSTHPLASIWALPVVLHSNEKVRCRAYPSESLSTASKASCQYFKSPLAESCFHAEHAGNTLNGSVDVSLSNCSPVKLFGGFFTLLSLSLFRLHHCFQLHHCC